MIENRSIFYTISLSGNNESMINIVLQNDDSTAVTNNFSSIVNFSIKDNGTSEKELSPIRSSLNIVIPITILYSLIFISGMLGNIITCIVIARNRAMHTATNYYLFSLAISDLLLLVSGLPFEIYEVWYRYPFPFGEFVCILRGFAAETSANATVLTITAFTAERYIAICHPFLSHTMSKLSRAIKFILGIWILAMSLAIPQILDLGLTKPFDTCGMKTGARKHVFTFSSILCFAFPMTVITVLYILIGLQLRRSKIVGRGTTANGNSIRLKTKNRIPSQRNILLALDRTGKASNSLLTPVPSSNLVEAVYSDPKQDVSQRISNSGCDEGRKNYSQKGCMGTRHVVNMLVAVVVAFFVCWAPHHAQRIFAVYADSKHIEIYEILTNISGILYYISTCINPFLYNIMSNKFREAFKDTCARYMYRRGDVGRNSNNGNYQNGSLTRNLSQHSNSQSFHTTCSSVCSGQPVQQSAGSTAGGIHQNSRLFLEQQDLSLLKCSKRPLTVKFRRHTRHRTLNNNNGSSNGILAAAAVPAMSSNVAPSHTSDLQCDCDNSRNHTNGKIIFDMYSKSLLYHSYNEMSNPAVTACQIRPTSSLLGSNELSNYNEIAQIHQRRLNSETAPRLRKLSNNYQTIYGSWRDECPPSVTRADENDFNENGLYISLRKKHSNSNTGNSFTKKFCPLRNDFRSESNVKHQKKRTTSPYESPELTASSRLLEEKIENMLKDLVLYEGKKSYGGYQFQQHLQKSKSFSHLAGMKIDTDSELY